MRPSLLLASLLALLLPVVVRAHPAPDVPVQATFDASGAGVVRVEFDLRFVDPDPTAAPYFKNEFLADKPADWRGGIIEKARAFITANVQFFLEPGGPASPEWQWEFTGQKNAALAQAEDPVMLTGTWRIPAGSTGYRIRSAQENKWSVLFLNTLRGKDLDRTQVLFPGESSFTLDLAAPAALPSPAAKTGAIRG